MHFANSNGTVRMEWGCSKSQTMRVSFSMVPNWCFEVIAYSAQLSICMRTVAFFLFLTLFPCHFVRNLFKQWFNLSSVGSRIQRLVFIYCLHLFVFRTLKILIAIVVGCDCIFKWLCEWCMRKANKKRCATGHREGVWKNRKPLSLIRSELNRMKIIATI